MNLVTLDTRSNLRAAASGAVIGGLFTLVETLASPNIPSELLVVVYAASLILLSAAFVRTVISGLVCGVVTLTVQTTLEVSYYASTGPYGISIVAAVLLSSAPLLYRFVVFPVAGALAGYLGQRI